FEALPGDVRTEDVDVSGARGRLRRGDRVRQVPGERDAGNRLRGPVGEDDLRSLPAAAERLALALGTAVRIVAAVRPAADEQRADLRDQRVDQRIRAEVRGQPGHVPAGSGDEAVDRAAEAVEQFRHGSYLRRLSWTSVP